MRRRRSAPWIHRQSRPLIGAIAILGALDTAYLTLVETGVFKEAVCPTGGVINCQAVLSSSYAWLFGVPLSLFGFLAYTAIAVFAFAPQLVKSSDNKDFRRQVDDWSWLLMFAGSTAMVVFSGYLVYLMSVVIGAFCIYCLVSAFCSIALFVLTIIGREWEDVGQLFFTGIVVGMVALIGTLGVYGMSGEQTTASGVDSGVIPQISTAPKAPYGWKITTTSGEAEMELARHLTAVGAKKYGAFTCPHCHDQKELFGKEAFSEIDYIECNSAGKNPQPKLCQAAGIKGYPTWEINGQLYPGVQSLETLADLTDYQGKRDFKYRLPR